MESEIAFWFFAILAFAGAVLTVGSRGTPVRSAAGYLLATSGMAGGAWLSGAPVVAWVMILCGLIVLLTLLLFSLEWVGTGGDDIERPTTGRLVARAAAGLLALGVLAGALAGLGNGLPLASEPLAPPLDAARMGAELFGRHVAAISGVGLLLLVGVLAAAMRPGGGEE